MKVKRGGPGSRGRDPTPAFVRGPSFVSVGISRHPGDLEHRITDHRTFGNKVYKTDKKFLTKSVLIFRSGTMGQNRSSSSGVVRILLWS